MAISLLTTNRKPIDSYCGDLYTDNNNYYVTTTKPTNTDTTTCLALTDSPISSVNENSSNNKHNYYYNILVKILIHVFPPSHPISNTTCLTFWTISGTIKSQINSPTSTVMQILAASDRTN